MKKCPFCAEEIQLEAIKCKHCGEWLNNREISDNSEQLKDLYDQDIGPESRCTEINNAQNQDNKSDNLSYSLDNESSKAKKLMKQFSIIFWCNIILMILFILVSSEVLPKTNSALNIIVPLILIFSLAFYIQVGRIASFLNRSIITWVGICIIFQAIGAIYTFFKFQTLLRENS